MDKDALALMPLPELIQELSERLITPKGGSCQHGARNYFLEVINEMRKEYGMDLIPDFPIG